VQLPSSLMQHLNGADLAFIERVYGYTHVKVICGVCCTLLRAVIASLYRAKGAPAALRLQLIGRSELSCTGISVL
jgi:hypothetical protein